MRVLAACEYSGKVRDAFRARGHDAWSCDLLESEDDSPYHLQGDVRLQRDGLYFPGLFTSHPLRWDLVIVFSLCTDLASSGARWFAEKRLDGRQQASIDFFMQFTKWDVKKMSMENPVGIMSRLYRKPDQIIHPWQFGHGETKATCLWLKGLPKLAPTNIVEGREARVHRMPPSPDRWKERSRTYQGIADAMAAQWG